MVLQGSAGRHAGYGGGDRVTLSVVHIQTTNTGTAYDSMDHGQPARIAVIRVPYSPAFLYTSTTSASSSGVRQICSACMDSMFFNIGKAYSSSNPVSPQITSSTA